MSNLSNQSSAPLVSVSPTTIYSGPPPPYSYASSTANAAPVLNALISPAESRRASGDEKEGLQRPSRESLPSIHEALKHGGAFSTYPLPETTPISITQQSKQPPCSTVAVSSAGSMVRSHPSEDGRQDHPINGTSPHASIPYPTQTQHPSHHQSHQTSYSSAEARRISLPAIFPFDHRLPPALPTLRTGQSSLPPSHPDSQTPQHPSFSPRADRTPTSASSMNSNFIYPSYPPQYLYPAQPASQPLYQSLTGHHQRPFGPSSIAEIDAARVHHDPRQPYRGYATVNGDDHGVSVKRHLDHLDYFDVEASLRDMLESSVRLADFSKDYRPRVRDIQRTGCLPGMLPTIAECDEMIRHQHRIQEVLGRLREMLVTQQDAALNRHGQERVFKTTHPDFEMEDPGLALDDNKSSGNMNPEARKRRGRAAPPGRCHSCNRAETPEWRRGPDGARTLCNACGLHYAKLTRKLGPKASLSGSSLRPKSMNSGPGPGPPQSS